MNKHTDNAFKQKKIFNKDPCFLEIWKICEK